jgi:glycosyltransferase involved in cell wall biosynthesis
MHKILFDCEKMRYPNTGLYYYCKNLGNALIKTIVPRAEELSLYVPPRELGQFGDHKHLVRYHPLHKHFHPGSSKYDVWHCTFQTSRYLPSSRKPKVVLTIHDLNYIYEFKNKPEIFNKFKKRIQHNIDRAETIVAISDYVARDIRANHTIKDQNILTIYNGWNASSFPGFDRPSYRPGAPFLFTIGNVIPKKNFHVLPALLKGNDYELIIAGIANDPYEEKIVAEAKRHGVASRVKIIGAISEEDKYWYYKQCTAFVFPSLAEGFGFPVVEAMYHGRPVFLSNLTSLPEIGGELAYYFHDFDPAGMQASFEEGMRHYQATNPKEEIIARTKRLFTWENAANQYLNAYRQLY